MGAPSGQRGVFITFEGTEGCGKSTQILRLQERLESQGLTVHSLREPGGTPIGEEIRHTLQHSQKNHAMTPMAELLLFNASRAQLVGEVIEPALAAGEVVLCDRFYDSTLAYQAHGRGLDFDQVRSVIDLAVGSCRPDLTLLLEVPLELSLKRRQARADQANGAEARDRMEEAGLAFFRKVEDGYRQLAASEPGRIRVLDGTQGISEVESAVWELVAPRIASLKTEK